MGQGWGNQGAPHDPHQCIAKQINQKTQAIFALIDNGDTTFSVLKLCENYDGHVRGGIRKTWRSVVDKVSETTARQTFNRRTA